MKSLPRQTGLRFWLYIFLALQFAACQPVPTTPDAPATPPATQAPPPTATLPTPTATSTASATPTLTPQPARLCSPLASDALDKLTGIITQPFVMPRIMDDGSYKDDAHHGVDLGYYTRADGSLFTGTPVLAALSGKIAGIAQNRPPYGNAVIMETPFAQIPAHVIENQSIPEGASLYTLYAHLQNLQPLQIGKTIECGQPLAETGLTGFTGGPHLHFETRWSTPGQTFVSMAYYRADTSEEERANYQLWRMSGTFHLFDPMILLSPPQIK